MRSAGGSRLAPDRVFEGIVEFRRRTHQPGTVGAAVGAAVASSDGGGGGGALRGGDGDGGGARATRGRRGRRRAQVIEATRGGPGDAVEGGAVLREEREGRE